VSGQSMFTGSGDMHCPLLFSSERCLAMESPEFLLLHKLFLHCS
jgi:hypothetical protein